MTHFKSFLEEVTALQTDLQSHVNEIRKIEGRILTAFRAGHQAEGFLPRRLHGLARQEQEAYRTLLSKFHRRIDGFLSSHLMAVESSEDLKTILKIRTAIRYIRNAFVGEIPLRTTLTQLDRRLPGQ